MSRTETTYSIVNVEGEVMIYDRDNGWERAKTGMVFPQSSSVTIKTGKSGRAVIVNDRGEFIAMSPYSMRELNAEFAEHDDIDTLRQIRLTAMDMMLARCSVRQLLQPAV